MCRGMPPDDCIPGFKGITRKFWNAQLGGHSAAQENLGFYFEKLYGGHYDAR